MPVHRDLTKYRAKVVGGLTARTLACVAAAVGASVGAALVSELVLHIDFDNVSWLAYALSLPFWAAGFWRPHGMTAEEWLPLWLRHASGADRLTYDTAARYEAAGLTEKGNERGPHDAAARTWDRYASRRRGVELWSPGDEG